MTLRYRFRVSGLRVQALNTGHFKLCALALSLTLSSCIAAGGRGDSWAAVSVGTDARRLSASRQGLQVEEMIQSRGLEMARKQLRNAALISAGVPAIKEVAKEAIP